ncbi:MAG: PLP-dependent aminotransferase family protein [Solobacterium sp.]|nr:PLP-dependent aminotransferase family protein [Solobacterium sp.]
MKQTKYLKIYEDIKQKIISGIYSSGDKLPSKRTLAEQYGVSLITVEQAYRILSEEGYIQTRERSGYYVIYKTGEIFTGTSFHTDAVPHSTRNYEDEDFSFAILAKTMRKIITEYYDSLVERSPNSGCKILKDSIRLYLARSRGMIVEEKQIIIGSGAEHLYGLLVQFFGADKIYATEDPSYSMIRNVYKAYKVQKIEYLKMDHTGIRSDELQRSQADVLHVTPYNSYPSGITAGASKKQEYVQWAIQHHSYIIEDDFDSEFTLSSKAEDTLYHLSPDHVFYLNTFSKTISPSMRVGYMIVPEHLVEEYNKKLGFYSCSVPVFEQYLIAELINSGSFERHINRVRRMRRRRSVV